MKHYQFERQAKQISSNNKSSNLGANAEDYGRGSMAFETAIDVSCIIFILYIL